MSSVWRVNRVAQPLYMHLFAATSMNCLSRRVCAGKCVGHDLQSRVEAGKRSGGVKAAAGFFVSSRGNVGKHYSWHCQLGGAQKAGCRSQHRRMDVTGRTVLLRGIKPYVSASWRIPYVVKLANLASSCDAVFVHSSTASHYAVVSELLNAGVHVLRAG